MLKKTFYWLLFWPTIINYVYSENWLWQCKDGDCTKVSNELIREGYSSLQICQLVCSNYLNIWPQPTGSISAVRELVNVDKSIVFNYIGPTTTLNYLRAVTKYFENLLIKDEPFSCEENVYSLKIFLNPKTNTLDLNLDTDESYSLTIDLKGNDLEVHINAETVFGIRHGLETLLQLLIPNTEDGSKCLVTLNNVRIDDKPKYKHRGLLIDTSRNYLGVETIKRQIDGMAASKLNVLHWHMTDSQSFPFDSPTLPNMTRFGAYSPEKIYTSNDVKELMHYAEVRGVRILTEIDGPSHAGMGWQWGPEAGLGNLAVCVNKQPWRSFCIQPPCGQLNPVNSNVYKVLKSLYKDIIAVSNDKTMFHMGGDEVFIPCWNTTPEILDYLKDKPLTEETYLDLWAEYQTKNLLAFDEAVGNQKTSPVVWTSHLTQPTVIEKYLPKNRYIIQTWIPETENDLIVSLINLGYRLIISTKNRWYLDHGFWGTTTYYKWKTVYENPMTPVNSNLVLGGEVCMWGELVDSSNIDSRVWPRAAAAAERMWSNPSTSATIAQTRFFAHRERLVKRGIHPEAVIPLWCIENEGECSTYL